MDLTRITSRFNFYQQVRTLLHKLRGDNTATAETLDAKLRIVSPLSLDAPAGQIAGIEQENPEDPLRITVWQNGLTGALGALPTAYTEWMIGRQYRYGDHSAKAFLDMFGHRLYCLDYLAWQKNHLYALAESQTQLPLHPGHAGADRFTDVAVNLRRGKLCTLVLIAGPVAGQS